MPRSSHSPSSSSSCSSCCCWWGRGFVAFLLKFLNFLQAFVGVSIILYSIWMLNQWSRHDWTPRPALATGNANSLRLLPSSQESEIVRFPELALSRKLGVDMASVFDSGIQLDSNILPALWFIYSSMGFGILLCLVTCIGFIAAEGINGCCLCFYTMFMSIIIIFEAALVGFIAFNKQWDEDLPLDPTGELDSLRSFIEDNIGLCKWIGLSVGIIQALSLLLSMILRAMVSSWTVDYDSDDDYAVVRGESWQPLINSQGGRTSSSISMDGRGIQPNTWNPQMGQKYGLSTSAFTCNR